MPFYEYQCTACEHRLEALQKISDEPLRYCPECGEASLKKLISRAAFRLKGGGWYETDFKHSGAKKEDKASKAKTTDEAAPSSDGKSTDGKDKKTDAAKKSSSSAESMKKSA